MSTNAARPEQPAVRRRLRWVLPAVLIVVWLALGSVGGPFAGKLADVSENDDGGFLPASAESTKVSELEREFVAVEAVPAVVVAERAGDITAADRGYVADRRSRISDLNGVTDRLSPAVPSQDGSALQFVVPVDAEADPAVAVEQIRSSLADPPDGLEVFVTGPAGQIADLTEAFSGIDGLLLLVAGSVVAVILVLVYRSPLLPVLVLTSAVLALGLASVAVYLLADNDVLALNGQSQGILFILVFGAATDYALLLVARLREELRVGHDRYAAVVRAWRTTLEPIAASAATVIAGVLCLLLSDLESNRGLGPVAAIGVAAAFLASMTFLPAILAVFGRVAFWPRRPTVGAPGEEAFGIWRRIAGLVNARARPVWVGCVLLLLAGVAFLPQLKADGTARTEVFLTEVDSVAGQQVLQDHFPAGTGSPAVIIADAGAAEEVHRKVSDVDGVEDVTGAGGRDRPPRVVDGMVRLQAVLADPPDSDRALDTVNRLREVVHPIPGADAKVGGQSAVRLDTELTAERDLTVIIPLVLLVVLLVLILLLRALVAPLLLLATVVLSFASTMGVSALLFNHIFDFPGADPTVPLFGFVFLVALGIDYNIFLMTRVREETRQRGTRDGVLQGLMITGGVITSAGVVLAATFSALAVLPILFLAQIAFIVAFGVLLDALLVRSVLVPALTLDVGRRIWWPSRISRINNDRATSRTDV